tara:strand:+ start:819 stop:1343 length:525 start_codon:yes stop_codon:yes gene_type:complete
MKIKLKKINRLSECSKDDIIKWVKWLNDKEVTKYSEQRFKKHTKLSQINFINFKLKDKKSFLFKIIFENNFIGVIELGNMDHQHSNCEIMYIIGEQKYWSKGIGTRSINLALKFAEKNKIKKVYAGVYSNNFPSINVLKKNKFKLEGKISNFYNYTLQKKIIRVSKLILGHNLK